MTATPRFFKKNWADFERSYVSATASNTPDLAEQVLARSNKTGWATNGSSDAENTTLTINMGDFVTFDSILLIGHNWKNFKLEYLAADGVTWTAFASPIAPTTCTDTVSFFQPGSTSSDQVRATIYGTQVVDAEKILNQFIITTQIGYFSYNPLLSGVTLGRALQEQKVLSGKSNILQNVGKFSTRLRMNAWAASADLTIIETLFNTPEGFLYWPCGCDVTQFSSVRQGYRLQDIYLCRCKNEYNPDWAQGQFKAGLNIEMDLVEVIT